MSRKAKKERNSAQNDKPVSTLSPAARRTAEYGVLLAAALLLSFLESRLPLQIPVPGVRLGLSNLVLVVLLYREPFLPVVAFGVLKCLLSLGFSGRLSGLLFSLSGTLFALFAMEILRKLRVFSLFSVSVAGAIFHGFGQLVAASALLSPAVFRLTFVVCLASAACGGLNWLLAGLLLSHPALGRQKR